jgi:hypothetical protein
MAAVAVDLAATVERDDGLMSAPVDEELVFLNPKTDCYVALDAVGTQVWALLDRPRTVSDLVQDLEAAFEGSADVMGSDVAAFLGELVEMGMVRVVDPPAQ